MGAIIQRYGMEDAAVKALNAGVDVLLISQNSRKGKSFAAERAVVAIRRALADGWLSRSRVADALRHVKRLRARLAY